MQTKTSTITILVLQNNAGRQKLQVPVGTTLAELARQLKFENPQSVRAMNELNEVLTADTPLTEDGTVNFLENVSGA